MTCKLAACTEKTAQSSNTQPIILGSIVVLGLLYYFMYHSKRK